MADATTNVIIVGGGPVGLAAGLLLAAQGRTVTIAEARDEPVLSDANSYPIGVNPRGKQALRRIDPALEDVLGEHSETVAGWRIYAGGRLVAKLASGTVVSTTRAALTRILWERASTDPNVTLLTGHKLAGLDVAARTLTFDTAGGPVTWDAAQARVIAADGVWSAARRSLAAQLPGFAPRVDEWGLSFRVLYSAPGAAAPGLDPSLHYIFGGKGIYTATLADGVWGVVTTAVHGSDEEELLSATAATPERVRALQRFVAQHAPLAAPLLTEQDYADYFTRGSFTGAVVRCPTLNAGEWLVLIGDAAHAVIPPTGEGVNAGLEDAYLLAEHLASGSATPFADFSAARTPDLDALAAYAWHLMQNVRSTDPAFRVANVVMRILTAAGRPFGAKASLVEDALFGPQSDRTPYREILQPWLDQRDRVFPVVYRIVQAVRGVARTVRRR
ncbi:FAD-dependent oxidoreductase [Nigerium massiliense]|uniref:FAD-dependent oxidoreductase n=1 Tax=Nigerium massiliense TaxID=1522317 RepID=UPI00058F1F26|nr:NAD(P)/FAD-dependent oxidoreductase [Nigerium massiliense]